MLPSKILRVRKPKKLPKTLSERALDYLEKNFIVTIGAASTAFGLCVINAFLFSIEYSPTFDLTSIASVIFSATYVGITLIVLFGLLLFFPCLFVGISNLEKVNGVLKLEMSEKKRAYIRKQLIFSGFVFLAWFALALCASEYEGIGRVYLYGFCAVVVCLGLYVFNGEIFFLFPIKTGNPNEADWTESLAVVKRIEFVMSMLLLVLIEFFSVFLFFGILNDAPRNLLGEVQVGRLLASAVIVATILVGAGYYLIWSWFDPQSHKIHRLFSGTMVLVIPLLVSLLAENPAFIWMRIANATKIGNFYATEITLNKNGCEALSRNGVNLCNAKIGDSYKICGAYVMSRIGTETFLKLNIGHDEKKKRRLLKMLTTSLKVI